MDNFGDDRINRIRRCPFFDPINRTKQKRLPLPVLLVTAVEAYAVLLVLGPLVCSAVPWMMMFAAQKSRHQESSHPLCSKELFCMMYSRDLGRYQAIRRKYDTPSNTLETLRMMNLPPFPTAAASAASASESSPLNNYVGLVRVLSSVFHLSVLCDLLARADPQV